MSLRLKLLAAGAAAIALAAGSVALPAAAQAQAQTQAAPSVQTTVSGHTFTSPSGWTTTTSGALIRLQPPEADSTLAFADLKASSAEDAVAKAWALYKPDLKPSLEIANPGPASNGWEEIRGFSYKTSPDEKAVLQAQARRAGDSWVVVLIDFKVATLEKRSSPLGLAVGSLRPKGYAKETFAGRTPHSLDAARIKAMRTFVAEAMKAYGVPGVGFSLIDGGKVVFEGGEGVRTLGRPEKVDARTRFMAASNTKAMSTLLLAKAVDEGKLRWDEKAVDAYPAFRLADPDLAKRVEIHQLVCACTGIPRQDLEWIFGDPKAPAASIFDTLATMKPTSKFGEVFQYSNLMASAAGYIAASYLEPGLEVGRAYDKAAQDFIFTPLAMRDTTFDMTKAQTGDFARPHGFDIDGRPSRAVMGINYNILPGRPAGGMWTTAHDLSQYVLMELAKGVAPNGRRLVSEDNLLERRKPQIMLGDGAAYGMGLMVDKHLGVEIVHHGGDLNGYHSDMIWLPAYGLGGVILTNSDAGPYIRGPFLRKLLELTFDGKPEADEQIRIGAANFKAAMKKARELLTLPADPAAASKLAARYTNPALGGFRVRQKGGRVRFVFNGFSSEVATKKNPDGSFTFVGVDPGASEFALDLGVKDGKTVLFLRDAQHEYVFSGASGS